MGNRYGNKPIIKDTRTETEGLSASPDSKDLETPQANPKPRQWMKSRKRETWSMIHTHFARTQNMIKIKQGYRIRIVTILETHRLPHAANRIFEQSLRQPTAGKAVGSKVEYHLNFPSPNPIKEIKPLSNQRIHIETKQLDHFKENSFYSSCFEKSRIPASLRV